MCGISGYIGGARDPRSIERMVAALRHRGPDGEGVYVDPDAAVALGHNRLSILDLSNNASQPMADAAGGLVITFNGEIYNYRELRSELRSYPYRSTSDTEVILAAYEKWGEACVEKFIGMFAFAIWDRRRKVLFCARDRFGVKPFYFATHGGRFVFGSEIKALLAAGVPAQPDHRTWAVYLAHGLYDHDERTFFEGVQRLAPGTTLTVDERGERRVRRYWNLDASARVGINLDLAAATEQLDEKLHRAVDLRLRSDVPVGVNLSGGLDSSAMLSVLDDLADDRQELHAFTACFDDPRYDEAPHALRVSSRIRCTQHLSRLTVDEVPELSDRLMQHCEAPFGGIATLSYFKLHRDIRGAGLKVILEGQGADETLAGYNVFLGAHYRDLLDQGRCGDLRQDVRLSPFGRLGLKLARSAADGAPVYQDGSRHTEQSFLRDDVIQLAGAYPRFAQPFGRHLENALYRELLHTKLPRVLRMNDKLAMAHGIELRQPFLDHNLVEFLFRLPGDLKIRNGRGKFLLRNLLARRLPSESVWESKRAVVTPQREWMLGKLKPWIEDLLHSTRFRDLGYFDVAKSKAIFETYCRQGLENAFPIWQWLNCDLWFRNFQTARPDA